MKIAFTICANNYLAQAKTLGDSIKKINPEYVFYIGLTDKLRPDIDYQNKIGHNIILVEDIGIPNFDDLWKKYSLIEFSTCVKPFFFQYLISQYPKLDYLFYLDPDTLVINSLQNIETEFEENTTVLLTPHILTPIKLDEKQPNEHLFLNYGIYNLGFLGIKKPITSTKLIEWWQERTYNLGYNSTGIGLFVDQLWFNLVPLFFHHVKISNNIGLNMAPWNLHERKLSIVDESFFINNTHLLVFYHFSNYKYTEPDNLSNIYTRYNLSNNLALKRLYNIYHDRIIENAIEMYSNIECYYMTLRKAYYDNIEREREFEKMKKIMSSPYLKAKYRLKKITPAVLIRIYKALKYNI